MNISPQWTPADPDLVTISPNQGGEATITVRCAGESGVKLSAREFSKNLFIKTRCEGDTIRAEITQGTTKASGASGVEAAMVERNE